MRVRVRMSLEDAMVRVVTHHDVRVRVRVRVRGLRLGFGLGVSDHEVRREVLGLGSGGHG